MRKVILLIYNGKYLITVLLPHYTYLWYSCLNGEILYYDHSDNIYVIVSDHLIDT